MFLIGYLITNYRETSIQAFDVVDCNELHSKKKKKKIHMHRIRAPIIQQLNKKKGITRARKPSSYDSKGENSRVIIPCL